MASSMADCKEESLKGFEDVSASSVFVAVLFGGSQSQVFFQNFNSQSERRSQMLVLGGNLEKN